MTSPVSHLAFVGDRRADREARARQDGPWDVAVDCHRRLRGPYTGLGTVLRALVPDAHERLPELVAEHLVAILCAAPELAATIGSAPGTLTEEAPDEERTRWYSVLRSRRVSHDVVSFLTSLAVASPAGRLSLFFDTAQDADHTDREFLAIALRRLDPHVVRLAVGAAADSLSPDLAEELDAHAETITCPRLPESVYEDQGTATADRLADLARAFVDSDGTSDDPDEAAAYQGLDAALRASYHDRRADELEAAGELSLTLGAMGYHRLNGSEPELTAWPALSRAEKYCMDVGFYHAALESLDAMAAFLQAYPVEDKRYAEHYVAIHRGQVLGVLDRQDESQSAYIRALGYAEEPEQVMALHYNLGMLYTRFNRPEAKDHVLAKAHLNTCVAIASRIPDPAERAFYTVFMKNGLALVELHLGDLAAALRLVDDGLTRLDAELEQSKHQLHRSVLRHNRAQVLTALGRTEEALADFDALLEIDPYYAEYHFDRGNARSIAGDVEGALADYGHALALGAPFPELFHNRGELLASSDRTEEAIEDFAHVLEIEPGNLESRITLATLLVETGQDDAARATVQAGLAFHPENARLLCVLADAEIASGHPYRADEALERALTADPRLHQGYAIRASLRYDQDRFAEAVDDLTRALGLTGDDPDLLFNRGFAHEAQGDLRAAVDDYTRALDLPGAARDELLERRDLCLAQIHDAQTDDTQPHDTQPHDTTEALR